MNKSSLQQKLNVAEGHFETWMMAVSILLLRTFLEVGQSHSSCLSAVVCLPVRADKHTFTSRPQNVMLLSGWDLMSVKATAHDPHHARTHRTIRARMEQSACKFLPRALACL